MKTCPNGHSVPDDAKFCTVCGAVVDQTPPSGQTAQDQGQYSQSQAYGEQNQPPGYQQPDYQQGYQQYPPGQGYQQYPPGQGYQQYDPNQQYQQPYQQPYGEGVHNMPLTGFRGTVRSPGMVIFLSIITCGIYGIYWFYSAASELNSVLGYEETKPYYSVVGLLCFVFSYILMWQFDKALMEVNRKRGRYSESKFLVWILLSIFVGIGFFVMQYEVQSSLNELYEGR